MAVCDRCGAEFVPKRANQRFCCKECRWRSNARGSWDRHKHGVDASVQKYQQELQKEREKKVYDLRVSGLGYKEILETIGYYTGVGTIKSICTRIGANVALREKRNEAILGLRRDGWSIKQLAEHFDLTYMTVSRLCSDAGLGGALSKRRGTGNQYTKRTEQQKKEYVDRVLPDGFSYVGGYSGCDGTAILRCDKCGYEFERSMVSLRHGKMTTCPACAEREKEEKRLADIKLREEKERLKEEARILRVAELEKAKLEKQRLAICPVCGKAFYTTNSSKVCCSPECSRKRAYRRKDRRIKHDKRIDRGISARSLYVRDNGICWICGEKCDLTDFVVRDRTIICGNNYPSVDHVIPICEGGCDSWENVRLAHRQCNLERYLQKNG